MKKKLIKLAWLLSTFLAASMLPAQNSFAQTHNIPYPIIFVHGLNSSSDTWGSPDISFDNVISYLNGAGMNFGGRIDINLNYNLALTGVNNKKEDDVHLFTTSPGIGDYYTINFNVRADRSPAAGAETTLISGALAFSDDAALFVYNPSIFKANDIISVDNELMQVTGYAFGSLQVNRGAFGTQISGHLPSAGVFNLSNESNQESIVKQAYGLKQAIDAIKKADPTVKKVILVGHSMGGLAIREYLRDYYNNDVAKVVTIGTPHLGSNAGEAFPILSAAIDFANIDTRSNAIRDLCYNFENVYADPSPAYGDSPDDAGYLFGTENESYINFDGYFYSSDLNADGQLDQANGLDINMMASLPANVSYSWIVSDWNNIVTGNFYGDGLVRTSRQFPWYQTDAHSNPIIAIGDTMMTNRPHIDVSVAGIPLVAGEPSDYFSLLRGLDAPSTPALAYEIGTNNLTKGFITYGTNYNPKDTDLYKITLPANSQLKLQLFASSNTGINQINILAADQTKLQSITTNIYQPSNTYLSAGTYYVQLIGQATGVSYKYPYTLLTHATTVTTSLTTTPANGLNYYDEVINQPRDTTISITNNNSVPLIISGLTLSGVNTNQFAIAPPLGFTIQPGATQSFIVKFLPTSIGVKKANVNISNNSSDSPLITVQLQGNGVATATKKLVIKPDTAFNFGDSPITVLKAQAIILLDTGSAAVNISGLKLIGPNANEFFLSTPSPMPFTVGSNGDSVLFILNVRPVSVGAKTAQLVINNNATNKAPADTINLYANGTNSGSFPVTGNILGYEYWYDNNYASKVSVTTDEQGLSVLNTNFSTTGLTTGSHVLNIRYKDQNGRWSSVETQNFYKEPLAPSGTRNIVELEYWFDSNYSAKVDSQFSPTPVSIISANLNTQALTVGTHTANIRYKDDIGQWSSVASSTFSRVPLAPIGTRNIVELEYWFDGNYSAKVDTQFSPTPILAISTNLNTAALTNGTHIVNMRYKDDIGQWSSLVSSTFFRAPLAPAGTRNIVELEYWYDSNYSAKVDSEFSPTPIAKISTNLNTTDLTVGTHTINMRYKDDIGQWSSVAGSIFSRAPLASSATRNLVSYEYWFDSNYAAKVTVSLSPDATAVVNSSIPTASLTAGTHKYNVRFKDNAGQWSSVVTDTVTVLSKVATLAGLKLSSGMLTPAFLSTSTGYTASVSNATSVITVTPTITDATATITVNGTTVGSGSASAPISLAVGANVINVQVTAQDGVTVKTYSVTVTRASSSNAYLSNLKIQTATLSPSFAFKTLSYTATVPNATLSVTVTPSLLDPTATIKVNGAAVSSKTASKPISLAVGANTINVAVTAQDGTTIQTYIVTITRPSADAYLSNLTVQTAVLSPAFAFKTLAYTSTVSNSTTSVTVTPSLLDATASVKVNGTAVATKTASTPIALAVGANDIDVFVTAQDGITTQAYTVNITRAPSSIATLSSLATSNGNLSPAFNSGTNNYVLTVAASSIELTPTLSDASASVKINGTAEANGAASAPIPLSTGQNTVSIVVTAQDGTTTDTYTVEVYQGSTNDALSNLKVSSGTLSPAFNYQTTTYSVTVATDVTSIMVTPTAADANAAIIVNGVAVVSKAASGAISLAYGNNPITVVVTAQNGFSVDTYTINVDRPESAVATLSNLAISSGTLSPAFAPGTKNYSVVLPASITAVKVTPVLTDANATVKVNGTAVANGTASAAIPLNNGKNTITVTVTAPDGFDMDTYTITAYKGATNDALSNLKLSNGTLSPVFNYQTTAYDADVDNTISSITITPTAAHANAAITVNGAPVASKSASQPISLLVGVNPIIVTVTAQNGTTSQSYDVVVTRAAASANSVYQPVGVEKPTESLSIAKDGILVHQGISPNGDGIEDFLQIDNISRYPDNKLSIMNRNGQLIFEAKGYDNSSKTFDGHSNKNGRMQLPGTYFYSLDYTVNGATKHKTGFIVLRY